ncbi:MAG: hypothetical protein AB1530_06990, partial [Candidatus Omnitrophota bacterium]
FQAASTDASDELIADIFNIRAKDGLTAEELKTLGDPDLGILYDEEGQLRDVRVSVAALGAVANIKDNFSEGAKEILAMIIGEQLDALTPEGLKSLMNRVLFSKDMKDIDPQREYWYFNGDFTNPAFDHLDLLEVILETLNAMRTDFSAAAKNVIEEAYGVDLDQSLTPDDIETLANNLLFQKDIEDVDGNEQQQYWYFNGDFNNPAFMRLSLMQAVLETALRIRNEFSATAKVIILEAYGIDVNETFTADAIETLANELLFQRDTEDIDNDGIYQYWYFNGNFDYPSFDRLNIANAVLEAVQEIRTTFSVQANAIMNEAYGIDLLGTLTADYIKGLANNLLFQKDTKDADEDGQQQYWYFNGDFVMPQFSRLSLANAILEGVYKAKNEFSAVSKTVIAQVYNVDLDNLDKESIENLVNDLLFQRDDENVDPMLDYWYFNGDYNNPSFDRLNLANAVFEAIVYIQENFSETAKEMLSEMAGISSLDELNAEAIELIANKVLFSKDMKDIDFNGEQQYWYFNGDFVNPEFRDLSSLETVLESLIAFTSRTDFREMLQQVYGVAIPDRSQLLNDREAMDLLTDLAVNWIGEGLVYTHPRITLFTNQPLVLYRYPDVVSFMQELEKVVEMLSYAQDNPEILKILNISEGLYPRARRLGDETERLFNLASQIGLSEGPFESKKYFSNTEGFIEVPKAADEIRLWFENLIGFPVVLTTPLNGTVDLEIMLRTAAYVAQPEMSADGRFETVYVFAHEISRVGDYMTPTYTFIFNTRTHQLAGIIFNVGVKDGKVSQIIIEYPEEILKEKNGASQKVVLPNPAAVKAKVEEAKAEIENGRELHKERATKNYYLIRDAADKLVAIVRLDRHEYTKVIYDAKGKLSGFETYPLREGEVDATKLIVSGEFRGEVEFNGEKALVLYMKGYKAGQLSEHQIELISKGRTAEDSIINGKVLARANWKQIDPIRIAFDANGYLFTRGSGKIYEFKSAEELIAAISAKDRSAKLARLAGLATPYAIMVQDADASIVSLIYSDTEVQLEYISKTELQNSDLFKGKTIQKFSSKVQTIEGMRIVTLPYEGRLYDIVLEKLIANLDLATVEKKDTGINIRFFGDTIVLYTEKELQIATLQGRENGYSFLRKSLNVSSKIKDGFVTLPYAGSLYTVKVEDVLKNPDISKIAKIDTGIKLGVKELTYENLAGDNKKVTLVTLTYPAGRVTYEIASRQETAEGYKFIAKTLARLYPVPKDNLAAGELEEVVSEDCSIIYRYTLDLQKNVLVRGEQLGEVEPVTSAAVPESDITAKVLERRDLAGQFERAFGVEPETGKEFVRFYPAARLAEVIRSQNTSDIYAYGDNYVIAEPKLGVSTVEGSVEVKVDGQTVAYPLIHTVPTEAGEDLIKDRYFAVNEDTGREIVRYTEQEAEVIISETKSDIYLYDATSHKLGNKPISHVKLLEEIILPETGKKAKKLERTGLKPRIFGVDPITGEETVRWHKGGEAEIIKSETKSVIYTENLKTKLADVRRVAQINEHGISSNVLERTDVGSLKTRIFGVHPQTGEENRRYYPKAGEMEEAISATESNIYQYNPGTYSPERESIAHVGRVTQMTLPTGEQVNILRRISTETKEVERVFGVDAQTGEEVISFYPFTESRVVQGPNDPQGETVLGKVVIDLGEKSATLESILEKSKIDGLGFTGKERVHPVYYYDAQFNLRVNNPQILTADNAGKVVGWVIDTDRKIQGHEDWLVAQEITPAGEFVIARAFSDAGIEQATIAGIPGPGNYYLVDEIVYKDARETGRVTSKAKIENGIYQIIDKLSTFTIFEGVELAQALDDYGKAFGALPDNKPYEWQSNFEAALNTIKSSMGKDDISIYAGRLHQERDGDFIIYRVKGDKLARVIAQHDPNGIWRFTLEWDNNGQAKKSIMLWEGDEVISASGSQSPAPVVQGIFGDKNLFAQIDAAFKEAQVKAKASRVMSLSEYLATLGISLEDNTTIPLINTDLFEKKGMIVVDSKSGKIISNNVQYSDVIEKKVALYLVPNDPLGRTLMLRYKTKDGEKIGLYLYDNSKQVIVVSLDIARSLFGFGSLKVKLLETGVSYDNILFTRINGEVLESEFTSMGTLAREQYPFVGHYFGRTPILVKGIEEVTYNTETPLEIPIRANANGRMLKTWNSVEINSRNDDEKYYVHNINEQERLAPNRTRQW